MSVYVVKRIMLFIEYRLVEMYIVSYVLLHFKGGDDEAMCL